MGETVCIERQGLEDLFATLKQQGRTLVGPVLRNGAILYDELENVSDLPAGWGDRQDAGIYRIYRRADEALFGYNSGPHSWKKFLFPAREKLWSARKTEDGFALEDNAEEIPRYAFIGVRACDIKAIRIQDKVFMEGAHPNPRYAKRRQAAFIVAVNCGQAAKTCFCTSMDAGPEAQDGYDIALTEIIEDDSHYFVATAGTSSGREVLERLPHRPARDHDLKAAAVRVENARLEMGRKLDTKDIKKVFYDNYDSPRWDIVADRCLSCANCTMACPTCFCSTVEDTADLTGDHAERWQTWDSCFTMDFSYIHGGSVRPSTRSRYRQWITHKLATWIDQFGTSGCVGCGRCIAWCPVGIDITEEARALRDERDGKE